MDHIDVKCNHCTLILHRLLISLRYPWITFNNSSNKWCRWYSSNSYSYKQISCNRNLHSKPYTITILSHNVKSSLYHQTRVIFLFRLRKISGGWGWLKPIQNERHLAVVIGINMSELMLMCKMDVITCMRECYKFI